MDVEAQQARLPNGSAVAAILAGSIGVCIFGVMVVLAEASSGAAQALNLIEPVGPLSGKVAGAILAWLVSWGALQKLWDGRQISYGKVRWVALALIVAGFALTFPPVFGLFAH